MSYRLVIIILSFTKYRNEILLHFVTIYDVFLLNKETKWIGKNQNR